MTMTPMNQPYHPPPVPPAQMTMSPPQTPMPPIGYPDVDEKEHNRIVLRVCEEEGKRINELDKVFPHLTISPGVQMTPAKRLERGLRKIMEGNMGDPMMAQLELSYILSPTYFDDIKQGFVPPPLSLPWVQMLPIGYYFKLWHKQFLDDYDAGLERAERRMPQLMQPQMAQPMQPMGIPA